MLLVVVVVLFLNASYIGRALHNDLSVNVFALFYCRSKTRVIMYHVYYVFHVQDVMSYLPCIVFVVLYIVASSSSPSISSDFSS